MAYPYLVCCFCASFSASVSIKPNVTPSTSSIPQLGQLVATPGAFLPFGLGNWLFFTPQYAFAFAHVTRRIGYSFTHLFGSGSAIVFAVLLWGTTAVAYAYVTRRSPIWRIILMAPVAICITIILVHVVFAIAGFSLEIDAP